MAGEGHGSGEGTSAPHSRSGARRMDICTAKVTLHHIEPPIWRRLELPADIKLGRLHKVLQTAFGWSDSHLHVFRVGEVRYGIAVPHFADDATVDERNVRLDGVARQGDTLIYEYDFGDGWEHELRIERVAPADPTVHYPRCTGGERACPPEDCGGPPGYQHLLQVLRDPTHEEHEEMREWIGGDFDAEAFNLDSINKTLWKLK